MSRKKRDAFRCTGAVVCEIRSLLRSSIGISVRRGMFLGCWMWPCHWDFIEALFSWQVSGEMAILVDGSVLSTGRNHSKRVVWCTFCWSSHEMILSLFVAGAVLCAGFEMWKFHFRGRRRESRLRGVTEITFRGRRSTLFALDVCGRGKMRGRRKESWGCESGRGGYRCHIGIGVWAGVVWRGWNRQTAGQDCVTRVLRWVFALDFWRKSRTKRTFCRLWRVSFWGSLVRNARFGDLTCGFGGSLVRNARVGDLTCDFWRTSRTKRSFWRLDVWLLEEVSYEECPTRVSHKSVPQECPTRVSHKSVLQECPTRVSHKSVPNECPTRVSHKSVPQEFPTRVSHKSLATRVSHKSVP